MASHRANSKAAWNKILIEMKQTNITMAKINIPEADEISFKDFSEGNSVQVRAVISKDDEKSFQKGQTVTVSHKKDEASGKIVSDPIVINESSGEGKKTLSLIVEKV